MKRILSVLLAVVMLLPTLFGMSALAASYPSISASKYIEFKAQQNINVYKDKNCKTRGTCSPAKAYNASISKNDVCYIYEIASSYLKVNYPTSSGRKTGFIRRSDLFSKTAAEQYTASSKASVSVYKAQGTSSIAKGDRVWLVDTKNDFNGYRAVIYDAVKAKRGYKLGWITEADYKKVFGVSGGSDAVVQPTSGTTSVWPVGGNGGTHRRNWPKYSDGSYHSGTDISAPTGTPVYATYGGVVDTVKSLTSSYGKYIILKCKVGGQTVYVYYCHLNSFNVKVGDTVKAGQKIGTVGNTGKSSGSHLHYEVRNSAKRYGSLSNPTLNPYNFLPAGR